MVYSCDALSVLVLLYTFFGKSSDRSTVEFGRVSFDIVMNMKNIAFSTLKSRQLHHLCYFPFVHIYVHMCMYIT